MLSSMSYLLGQVTAQLGSAHSQGLTTECTWVMCETMCQDLSVLYGHCWQAKGREAAAMLIDLMAGEKV